MAESVLKWHQWLNLDEKWLPKLTESLKNIKIDGNLQNKSWDEQLEYFIPGWIEKVTSCMEIRVQVGMKKGAS